MTSESLLQFPCRFPIKVMGKNSPEVRRAVRAAAAHHDTGAPDSTAPEITERPSRTGKYLAFTITMHFESRQNLDRLYQALVAIDGVSMVL